MVGVMAAAAAASLAVTLVAWARYRDSRDPQALLLAVAFAALAVQLAFGIAWNLRLPRAASSPHRAAPRSRPTTRADGSVALRIVLRAASRLDDRRGVRVARGAVVGPSGAPPPAVDRRRRGASPSPSSRSIWIAAVAAPPTVPAFTGDLVTDVPTVDRPRAASWALPGWRSPSSRSLCSRSRAGATSPRRGAAPSTGGPASRCSSRSRGLPPRTTTRGSASGGSSQPTRS